MIEGMKTPEQLAEDYADFYLGSDAYSDAKASFLAGYEAAQPRWIRVEERLPRPGQEVLIVDDQIMRVQAVSSYGKWHPYVNGSSCKPTHWMPLPELPEEK